MNSVTPRPMPTPDLAGLLAKPARPPAPSSKEPVSKPPVEHEPATHAEPDDAPATASTVTPPSTVTPSSTRTRQPKSEQPSAATSKQYLRSIAVYLPRSIHQATAQKADTAGTTRTALILAAVNATHEQLGAALANNQPDNGGGDLFDIPQRKQPSELTVQTSIRVTDRQLQVIDALVAQHETNRSRLLTTALKLYLNN